MTPEQLKASILQYAIQGKLVEQRPEEGTAEELYQQIQEEKKILIKEGKIKKEKSLAKITEDETPFDIPASWMWVRHNELFEIVGGSQPPKSNFKDVPSKGDVRLYQIRDYGEAPVPVYVDRNLVSKFTEEGDILLARYGGSLGKVFWAKEGAYNVAMAKIVMMYKTELVDKTYLYYYYLAPLYQNLVKGSNRAAQGGFNKDDLNALMFPLPPLKEQRRIVAKIEELLPYADRYGEAYEKLEQFNAKFPEDMKKSILQYAIQGKLVEQRPEEGTAEDLYLLIQEEKKRLIKEGKIKKDETAVDGFPCVRYGQLYTTYKTRFSETVSYVPQDVFDKCKKAHKNDILMALTGENEYDIALAVTYEGEEELAIGGDMTRFFNHCMNPLYLTYVLNSRYGILCKSKMATGNIIVHISNDKLASIPIPLPPLEEQHRIVAKIEELLPYCDQLIR